MTKVYALYNIKKKSYYSTGHGCAGGVKIVNFDTKQRAENFIVEIRGQTEYIVKGISVGG